MKNRYIEGGKFVGTHGVRGALRVQPWCDSADFLCDFKKVYIKSASEFSPLQVLSAKPHGNVVLMEIKDVESIEAADRLRGKVLYLDRKDFKLDDESYLICDIIGCEVYHADGGALLGKISDVSKTGANDVWHVKNDNGEYLIPVIEDVVISVDIDAERVVIRPLNGIFED